MFTKILTLGLMVPLIAIIVIFVLEVISTYIGLKLAKIESEFKEILKVSLYKAILITVLKLLPFGSIIALIASIFVNKTYFNTDWNKGILIELPLIILQIIVFIFSMLLAILLISANFN
ncbi:ABC-type multidrug transport system permease subunit [Methanococcus voltae]|uniref:hypothetical protein n=1 Tax=Methanococcus voltae TaxID=2188 RepID=UPI001AE76E81|nr:hypothetical protein [Methanococcus voltae]MBP2144140.1 ABC-type multidrug transport system permease subunit [Methanococcus voltae]